MKTIIKYFFPMFYNLLFGIFFAMYYFFTGFLVGYENHDHYTNWYSYALATLTLQYYILFFLILIYIYLNVRWFRKVKMQSSSVAVITYLLLTVPFTLLPFLFFFFKLHY